jgi:hypothetical protein
MLARIESKNMMTILVGIIAIALLPLAIEVVVLLCSIGIYGAVLVGGLALAGWLVVAAFENPHISIPIAIVLTVTALGRHLTKKEMENGT